MDECSGAALAPNPNHTRNRGGFHKTHNALWLRWLQNPENPHFLNRASPCPSVTYDTGEAILADYSYPKAHLLTGFQASLGSILFCETPISRFYNPNSENVLDLLNLAFSSCRISCFLYTFHETRAYYETARTYST